jgi:DNA polymerase alpha subunit B
MANSIEEDLNTYFAPPTTDLPRDILGELRSILRLHSITPQELFFKWESYSIKMGSEETKLDLETARAFKKDVQETLERETRGKTHVRSAEKRGGVGSTPRNITSNGDVFGMWVSRPIKILQLTLSSGWMDWCLIPPDLVLRAVRESERLDLQHLALLLPIECCQRRLLENTRRQGQGKLLLMASSEISSLETCLTLLTWTCRITSFADRTNAGQTVEQLNQQLPLPEALIAPYAEPRIKMLLNTDMRKFGYRPMAMHLSEASEVLDDRIDEFMGLIQAHHGLEDDAFGNPYNQSTSEVVAVGRIASDSADARLNSASIVLEVSRRMGAGRRVPLKMEALEGYEVFPGQILAMRGINSTGESFSVSKILAPPPLAPAASSRSTLEASNDRLRGGPDSMQEDEPRPLSILVASGPYTAEDNLAFEPLHTLCSLVGEAYADALILTGPFLDIEHPLIAAGDIDLPDSIKIDPEEATLTTIFRALISAPLRQLADSVPNITIIMVPSVRDAVSKHVSWPQEPFPKKELQLPKQVRMVSNPVTVSLNEIMIGISSQDILDELRREECASGKLSEPNILARLPRHLIEQRHFFPLFPPAARENLPKNGTESGLATGAMLDASYLKLGEWFNANPDILITPSSLPPFVKVVQSVLVINPGTLSKRKGPGTFAQLTVYPAKMSDDEQASGTLVGHKIYERGRVDITRI